MRADSERGIWFIDTPEATEHYGNEKTSICYQFHVNHDRYTQEDYASDPCCVHGRSDLQALHQALPDIASRVPLVAELIGKLKKSGFDPDACWDSNPDYPNLKFLMVLRQLMFATGFFLLWNKTLHLAGDVYDPDRIRNYLLSVPDGVAFLDWPLDAEITVFGYKSDKPEEMTFRHLVKWGALLGDRLDKESRYRKLLGLSGATTKQDVRKRFLEVIAKYHPDKVSHLAREFQSMAEEKSKALIEAYEYFRTKDDVSRPP